MQYTNTHTLVVSHTEEDNLNVLLSYIDGTEASSTQVCDVDRLDSVVLSLFKSALASDEPFTVVVATARNRATQSEHYLKLNIQNVLRDAVAQLPETFVTTLAGEYVEVTNDFFFPRVQQLALPWMAKGVLSRFNAFVESLCTSPLDSPEKRASVIEYAS